MLIYSEQKYSEEPFKLAYNPDPKSRECLERKGRICQAAREVVMESYFEQMSGDYIVSYKEMKALIEAVKADPEEEA